MLYSGRNKSIGYDVATGGQPRPEGALDIDGLIERKILKQIG